MRIWAHTLVRNEERYLWYAVMSIIDYVDKVLLWDTGSDDATLKIIKEISKARPDKISFKQRGVVDPDKFTQVRQEMLNETSADWFMIVDGDEVWWEDTIKKVVEEIKKYGNELESIVTPTINLVGDIYHFQEEAVGQYRLAGRKGHLSIRAVNRKIPGLHFKKPHGQIGLYDGKDVLIQERPKKYGKFVNAPYLHFTNVIRSASRKSDLVVPKRGMKLKYELGIPFPYGFYYPEIFFRKRPEIVPNPWETMSFPFWTRALIETPVKRLKRKLISGKVGY